MPLSDRLEDVRERIKEKKEERQREKRRQELRDRFEQQARRARIQRNEPEGAREEVQASARQARLLAAEFGVTRERGAELADSAQATLSAARDSNALSRLDLDGDGDTDILESFEESLDTRGGRRSQTRTQQSASVRVGEPYQPVEEELGLDGAFDDEFDI